MFTLQKTTDMWLVYLWFQLNESCKCLRHGQLKSNSEWKFTLLAVSLRPPSAPEANIHTKVAAILLSKSFPRKCWLLFFSSDALSCPRIVPSNSQEFENGGLVRILNLKCQNCGSLPLTVSWMQTNSKVDHWLAKVFRGWLSGLYCPWKWVTASVKRNITE